MTVVTSLNKTFRCSDSESSPMDAQEKVVSSQMTVKGSSRRTRELSDFDPGTGV